MPDLNALNGAMAPGAPGAVHRSTVPAAVAVPKCLPQTVGVPASSDDVRLVTAVMTTPCIKDVQDRPIMPVQARAYADMASVKV